MCYVWGKTVDEAVEHQRFLSGKKKGQCRQNCAGCQQLALTFGGLPGTVLLLFLCCQFYA
jgi:hypothetical protein